MLFRLTWPGRLFSMAQLLTSQREVVFGTHWPLLAWVIFYKLDRVTRYFKILNDTAWSWDYVQDPSQSAPHLPSQSHFPTTLPHETYVPPSQDPSELLIRACPSYPGSVKCFKPLPTSSVEPSPTFSKRLTCTLLCIFSFVKLNTFNSNFFPP